MKILDRKPKRQHTSMLNFLFVCKKGDETFHRRTKLSWSPVIVAILCDGCTSVCLSVCVMAARLSVCLCDGCTSVCVSVCLCVSDWRFNLYSTLLLIYQTGDVTSSPVCLIISLKLRISDVCLSVCLSL